VIRQRPLFFLITVSLFVFAAIRPARTATSRLFDGPLIAQQLPSTPATPTQSQTAAPSVSASPEATPIQSPSSELANTESQVRPSVIWVTAFDAKGNLLRTETGFFISADGRLATTERAVEHGANAVAKTADGGIYNISGILASSKELDVAVLQADVKPRKLLRFLELNRTGQLSAGASVVVIGSELAGNDGSAREMTIASEHGNDFELRGTTPASAAGSPVVDEAGAVVGVVTSTGEKTIARSSAALASLFSKVTSDTRPRWLASAEGSPTPKPTPKPRLVFAPAPAFPPGASQGGVSGTGRFRLSFDPNGNVTNVQLVKSTGNPYFDQSAIKTFGQWKSAPSQGWSVTVPVTFQTR
jgi:TonB family protein